MRIGLSSPQALRATGAVLAAIPALTILIFSDGRDSSVIVRPIALAGLSLGPAMGWLLAPRAVIPGWRSALGTASVFALVCVVLGSFLAASLVSIPGETGSSTSRVLNMAMFGLVLLGLPMFAVVVTVAIVWVAAVRAISGWGTHTH